MLSLLAACATPFTGMEPPDVGVVNVMPLEPEGPLEQRARVDLRITNPNDAALDITGFSFQLDLNGVRFARGVSNQAVNVPRLGEAKTSVVVSTGMLDMIRQLAALEKGGEPRYRITGKVYLANPGMHDVSFSHEGSLAGH